ncbi:MAG: hypothetical protein Ta2E_09220 [Mycoplasmoidaceae bacterium]|nr:MAG: hypothetical protein Ta2E_09220 [Mycoplasmoidaceae bacterium]
MIRNDEMKSKELTLSLRKFNEYLGYLEKAKANILDAVGLIKAKEGKKWDEDTESYMLNFLDETRYVMEMLKHKARIALGELEPIKIPEIEGNFNNKSPEDIIDWITENPVEEILDEFSKKIIEARNEILEKEAGKCKFRRQSEYVEDPRRTFNRIVKEAMPQCEAELDQVSEYFTEKWKRENIIVDMDEISMYQFPNTITKEMAKEMMLELYNKEKML